MKLAWRLVANPEKLWVQVMKAKYDYGPFSLPKMITRRTCSNIWRVIVGIWPDVDVKVSWSIRSEIAPDSGMIDGWIPGIASLMESCHGVIPQDQADFPVSYYAQNGAWKWDLIDRHVPSLICDKIVGLSLLEDSIMADLPLWSMNFDGCFSLKFAYRLLCSTDFEDPAEVIPLFKKIWHWKGPNRMSFSLEACSLKIINKF